MPEIRECFIHYKHAYHVLVEKLGLGWNQESDWTLQALFADATDLEAGISKGATPRPCLTDKHARGYVDQLNSSCTPTRGQKDKQTRFWAGTADGAVNNIDSLVLLSGHSTQRLP